MYIGVGITLHPWSSVDSRTYFSLRSAYLSEQGNRAKTRYLEKSFLDLVSWKEEWKQQYIMIRYTQHKS